MTTTEALQAIHAHPGARCLRVCIAVIQAHSLVQQFADIEARYGTPTTASDPTHAQLLAALEHIRAAAECDGSDALATLAGTRAADLAAAVEAWSNGYKFWRGGLHHAPRPQRTNEGEESQ